MPFPTRRSPNAPVWPCCVTATRGSNWRSSARPFSGRHGPAGTQVYQTAVRSYFQAVRKDPQAESPDLDRQHEERVQHAERLLPTSPLRNYGLERLVAEAKAKAGGLLAALDWLPDTTPALCGSGLICGPWET